MNENDSAAMTRAVSHALVWCRPIIVLKVRRVMGRGWGGVLILVRFEFHLHVLQRILVGTGSGAGTRLLH